MAEVKNQIEQIVREVIARLAQQPVGRVTQSEHPSAAGQLHIAGRVVSLSQLEGRVQDIREVVVRSDAVVTPAARDFLRYGEIGLTRLSRASSDAGCQLAIGQVETSYETTALVSHLEKGTTNIQQIPETDLATTIDALADHITTRIQPALLLTPITTAALCLANRRSGVRAAEVSTIENLTAAIDQAGINLLVVSPRAIPLSTLCRVVERFCECWPIGCPDVLREN